MDHDHTSDAAPTASGIRALSGVDSPGASIGPYRLLQVLGEGGFGEVWLAEQREPIARRVALKLIKAGMDSRAVIARFEQERQALALMDHPHIAKVFDAGTTAGGRLFFVMEHVRGVPITEYCDRERLTIPQRLGLFTKVCDAVQHAHTKGIIHRDLKPSNILVAAGAGSDKEEAGEPRPVIIDFGVAKAVALRLTEKTIFTEHGQLIGTPEYMSPEQAEMAETDIDTRTDVYALGVILYELLSGALPFDSRALRSAGYAAIQKIIREVDPPRPSTRLTSLGADAAKVAESRRVALRELAADLKHELEWIPLKAMRKERTERYRTAAELSDDIANYLGHRPLIAGPESAAYRLRKFVRRNRAGVFAAAAVFLALVLGLAGTAWQYREAQLQRDQAVAARDGETRQRQRAEAINGFIKNALIASDPNDGGTEGLSVADSMARAVRQLDEGQFRDQPDIEIGLRCTIAKILNGNSRPEAALAVAQRALEIARAGTNPSNTADALLFVNLCLETLGRYQEALPLAREALDTYRRIKPDDSADTAAAMTDVAVCLDNLGRLDEALPLYQATLDMERRLHAGDHPSVQSDLNNLGVCLQVMGRAAEALPVLQESLAMARRLYTGDQPDMVNILNSLGGCLRTLGRPAEAIPMFREALDMNRRLFKTDHPVTAQTLSNLGDTLIVLGRAEEALPSLQEALDMIRRLFPDDHPNVATCYNNLGCCLDRLGRYEEALPALQAALTMDEHVLGPEHPEIVGTLDNLARTELHLGRLDDALAHARRAADLAVKVLPDDHPSRARAQERLAEVQAARGAGRAGSTGPPEHPPPAGDQPRT